MHYKFNFNTKSEGSLILPPKLEFWVPLVRNAALGENEMKELLYESDRVELLMTARPALLLNHPSGEVCYHPFLDFGSYLVVAKLKNLPYLVVYEERKCSPEMIEKTTHEGLFFDNFFAPSFGGMVPKYTVFQKLAANTVPNSMILFKSVA